jgi:hypothetical protein
MRTDAKFIKSVMNRKHEFRVSAEFTLFGFKSVVDNLKIDTGCGFTTFPLRRLGLYTDSDILRFKEDDIDNAVPYKISYGVETGGQTHSIPVTRQEKIACHALGFQKELFGLNVGGMLIGDRTIRINYDRHGNLLLGMDILKDWDIHIGTTEIGDTVFLGCPKDAVSFEFYREMENTFGYKK